jgi:hypothetical protein
MRSSSPVLVLFAALAGLQVLVDAQANPTAPTPAPNVTSAAPASANVTAPTAAPAFANVTKACYSNLTEVQEIVDNKNPFVKLTFVICPNTRFKLGVPNSEGNCCTDGYRPIQLRKNTEYLCGADGSSKNSCVLVGGQYQVLTTTDSYNQEDKTGIVLKGLTFEDGGNAGALLVAPGDVTFIDCIFEVRFEAALCLYRLDSTHSLTIECLFVYSQNQRNVGAVSLLLYDKSMSGNRQLAEINAMKDPRARLGHTMNYYEKLMNDPQAMAEYREASRRATQQRQLQSSSNGVELTRQQITFDNCKFMNNTYGAKMDATNYGVIGGETALNDVAVKGCIFQNNQFGDGNITVGGGGGGDSNNTTRLGELVSAAVCGCGCMTNTCSLSFLRVRITAGSKLRHTYP